jgi:hypothetical protein
MGIPADDTEAKARARKVRIAAADLGWTASLSRTRKPYAADFDQWTFTEGRKIIAKVKGIEAAEEVVRSEIQRRSANN